MQIYKQLQEQLAKLKLPGSEYEETLVELLPEVVEDEESPITPTNSMEVTIDQANQDELLDKEQDLEKMVDDMCKWWSLSFDFYICIYVVLKMEFRLNEGKDEFIRNKGIKRANRVTCRVFLVD